MKYEVTSWGGARQPTLSITVGPPVPDGSRMSEQAHSFVATFPVTPPNDVERGNRARMLATKVCAFLNELEEKKAQLLELMTIAGANEK